MKKISIFEKYTITDNTYQTDSVRVIQQLSSIEDWVKVLCSNRNCFLFWQWKEGYGKVLIHYSISEERIECHQRRTTICS